MSFGNLSKILEKTSGIINLTYNKKDSLSLGCISQMKMNVIKELQGEFPDITMNIIDEVFNRLFSTNYMFNKTVCFDNGKNCFREFEENYPDFMVPEKYKELDKHFNKLKLLPQPAQRSKEWFDYRYNRITASDTAAAIDMNPYEPVEGFILKKCDPNFPFRDNATVFHGKKYEPVATMIYEHIYNTRVFEFGALPSEKYNFLGASPDGISSKYTLDNKFSERLGIMLEIKCPVTRDIHTEGTIAGDICPFYYYCQVQQQLACCTLDICDFWQCKLLEFKTRHEYLADTCNGNTSEGITDPKFPNMSNPVKIDIDSIKVQKNEEHTNQIRVDKSIMMEMKYPSLDQFIKSNFDFTNENAMDQSFDLIASCVGKIYTEEEVWTSSDVSKKELSEFLDQMNSTQFKEIEKFFETMPKLSHKIMVTNPKTNVESEVIMEGLASFFA
jgi:putative phage-type endonuclease